MMEQNKHNTEKNMVKENKEGKRDKIRNHARHLFADYGYKDVSLDRIASDAEVSKGAIFWHFENKLDLFLKIFSTEIEGSYQIVNESQKKSATEKLAANVKSITRFLLENQTLAKLMRVYIYEVLPLLKDDDGKTFEMELFDQFISLVQNILTAGIEKYEFRIMNTQDVAYLIVTLIVGAFYDWLIGIPNNFPHCVDNFMDVVLFGIKNSNEAEQKDLTPNNTE